MLELPEAAVIAQQLQETVSGKKITDVIAAQSPHKFAWFHGDPQEYGNLLIGTVTGKAVSYGGLVEMPAGDAVVLFGDGVNVRFHGVQDERPKKHQLLIEFVDGSAISASVQMYGGLWCFREGTFDNPYYQIAREKPSPLSDAFDDVYYDSLYAAPGAGKLSAKAFLATEQRIPGLGNGVLQDILFQAKIHPKKKVAAFTTEDKEKLYHAIKSTLLEITLQGGRDTERDLYGCCGGYQTKMSKNTVHLPCQECGTPIAKAPYMGGSIYYCSNCQKE